MKNRNGRAAIGALFAAVAALTVTACADTGSAYYGYNSGYRDFCNGPYRLQPEYCRYPEYSGSVYFGGTWRDGRFRYRDRLGHREYWHRGGWHRGHRRGERGPRGRR